MANWFLALPVDAAALPPAAFARLPAGTRKMADADLHITVAFLGAVGRDAALKAWHALALEAGQALTTHSASPAALGSPSAPTALGLDLEAGPGDGALTAFIARWRDPLCTAAGVASDPRPIRAHVTLGRPPRRAGPEWRPELDRWLREPIPQQPLYLDRIALYTRAAAESGRRFEAVAEQSL
jgi:2'-5' RNA ligase